MSSNVPFDPNNRGKGEVFNGFLKSINDFFQEKPVKNLLQTMDEFFRSPFPTFPLSIKENDTHHIIVAELPGINKEQITIDLFKNHLSISVNHHETITEENLEQEMIRSSQSYKRSTRTITLPYDISRQKIKASYQNGLLTIHVSKPKGKMIPID